MGMRVGAPSTLLPLLVMLAATAVFHATQAAHRCKTALTTTCYTALGLPLPALWVG